MKIGLEVWFLVRWILLPGMLFYFIRNLPVRSMGLAKRNLALPYFTVLGNCMDSMSELGARLWVGRYSISGGSYIFYCLDSILLYFRIWNRNNKTSLAIFSAGTTFLPIKFMALIRKLCFFLCFDFGLASFIFGLSFTEGTICLYFKSVMSLVHYLGFFIFQTFKFLLKKSDYEPKSCLYSFRFCCIFFRTKARLCPVNRSPHDQKSWFLWLPFVSCVKRLQASATIAQLSWRSKISNYLQKVCAGIIPQSKRIEGFKNTFAKDCAHSPKAYLESCISWSRNYQSLHGCKIPGGAIFGPPKDPEPKLEGGYGRPNVFGSVCIG